MNILDINGKEGEHPRSYFAASAGMAPELVPIEGDARTEICIIGGGYTGLSAALHLSEAGRQVTLIEAQRVGWGASGRNGGQVGSGQRIDQVTLERMLGPERARALWDIAEGAKQLVRDLIDRHAIACDLAPGIVTAAHRQRHVAELHAYAEHLVKAYDYSSISALDRDELAETIGTNAFFGGTLDRGAAHLHPLKFAFGLARAALAAGATMHERTRALSIERGRIVRVATDRGMVSADHVLIAANGYLGLLVPDVAARVLPINSYIAATEPMDAERAKKLIPDNVAVYDTRFVVSYFNLSADHRLLFGGREAYGYKDPTDISSSIGKRMLSIYPGLADLKFDYSWGGTLGITLNRMPHFAQLGPNILNASGFSGHGVALSVMAGRLMAEALAGKSEGFDAMARVPGRRFPGGTLLRRPLLVLAMLYYAMRDRF
ncbi:MAG: FAD-binding oxidoreductase [Alphaproteobacteria bacterium]|nr:FAD-binding oxidoreductase [Alphaproteobacteria bacterium]